MDRRNVDGRWTRHERLEEQQGIVRTNLDGKEIWKGFRYLQVLDDEINTFWKKANTFSILSFRHE